jgi:3-oxoacyl-[acyl-carrier protein] reductase
VRGCGHRDDAKRCEDPAAIGRSTLPGGFMKAAALFDLTHEIAIVTGASSGLGTRFAEVLAANGAAVALVARRSDRLAALKAQIEAAGGRAMGVAADVRDRADMIGALEAVSAAFGVPTILVNNAGVAHTDRILELSEAQWREVIATDLDAVFFWAQEAARRMIAAGKRGSIINVASILGLSVARGVAAYAVAKAGVISLTKALALELAFKGVRVNAIAPGYIITEMNRDYLTHGEGAKMTRGIPAGRFGEPGDLDGALLLLASDAGRFMAGSILIVDGGQIIALRG